MNVGEVCTRDLVSAPSGAPLSELARLMAERGVGAVVVTKSPIDAPVPAGMITDRDILRAQLTRKATLDNLRAGDVMTRDPLVLDEACSLEDAIHRMRSRGVRRAPVVSASGALVGLLSTDDLVSQVAHEIVSLARVLERQPRAAS